MTFRALPRREPAALSLLAGTIAVGAIANAPNQLAALVVEVLGLAACLAGLGWYRRGAPLLGIGVAAFGGLVALVALVAGLAGVGSPPQVFESLFGMLGLGALALGLGPIRVGSERALVTLGTAGTLLGVLLSSILHGAGTLALLVAAVACVVAWDAGEQAVGLGEQVGTDAAALRASVVHPAATAGVGAVGVVAAVLVDGLGVSGLSLPALLALLAAAGLTTFALTH